jgi:hypothetical protein
MVRVQVGETALTCPFSFFSLEYLELRRLWKGLEHRLNQRSQIFMCSFMWGMSNLSPINEKVIVIWLNSAVFFYLLLSRHTATQGSWVKLHKKSLMKIQMLDPTKLSKEAKTRLVKQYNDLAHYEWPSILDQYRSLPKKGK